VANSQTNEKSNERRLSHILAKVTLLLALILGSVMGLMQVVSDLKQEKNAVQYAAEEFLVSVTPSAASAAYNYYLPAAEQVVAGLFTQRAVSAVEIINEGEVMISEQREVKQTLPDFAAVSLSDPVVLRNVLLAPGDTSTTDIIGSISITVDRAVVAPAFVDRLVSYFLLATLKNVVLGVLLIAIVYAALAKHIVSIAEATVGWKPKSGALTLAKPPRMFRGSELETLGGAIEHLSENAVGVIREAEESRRQTEISNTVLSRKSQSLSQEVQQQNEELKRTNARLRELAENDALTGLRNRGSFDELAAEHFSASVENGVPVTVLLLDVDYFKAYNDYYGHQGGDICLCNVAKIIKSGLDSPDIMVARYGGEEFVALLLGFDATKASGYADKIHQILREERIEHTRSVISDRITVSIGLASTVSQEDLNIDSLDQLVSAADEALYEAKRRGRNRTVNATYKIRDKIRAARSKAQALLRGIEEKAFEPFFQPQFDARTGTLIGVEALARWRQSDGGVEAPAAFIKTAAKNGFLPLIDNIVLDGVSDLLQKAKVDGAYIPHVALNTPRDNLLERNYVERVIEIANQSETCISLELLETAIYDEPEDTIKWQIDALKEANVSIEIDDFGTGHTSILSLMSLKPSRLKVARELVGPMMAQSLHEQIIKSVINIGSALEIEVLAEGVEDKATSQRLVELGCPLQQGYFFAKPMPANALLEQLSAWPQPLAS